MVSTNFFLGLQIKLIDINKQQKYNQLSVNQIHVTMEIYRTSLIIWWQKI